MCHAVYKPGANKILFILGQVKKVSFSYYADSQDTLKRALGIIFRKVIPRSPECSPKTALIGAMSQGLDPALFLESHP